MRVDALRDLRGYDAGDVEMFSGDAERSVRDLQTAVHAVARTGAIPLILGGDHTIAWPDAAGVAQHIGQGRVSVIHFDAHVDTVDVEFGSQSDTASPCAGSSNPARYAATASCRSAAWLLAAARDAGLDGAAA